MRVFAGLFLVVALAAPARAATGKASTADAPGCSTDKRCWLQAVDAAVAACSASCSGNCSRPASASDRCEFRSDINGYRCTSVCDTPAESTQAAMTDKEKADAADESIGAMREVQSSVGRLAEEARGERDALRLNCVVERKTQISGLVKVAELAGEELRAAMKDRQTEAVDHEYNKVLIARGKVDGYKTEAEQCIGMLAFYTGDTERIYTEENPDSKNVDPTSPAKVQATSFRPPAASPLR